MSVISPSCLQSSPFLRLKIFSQSVLRGLFLTELQRSLFWLWAQSSVSDCPPSCGDGLANWTLMDQNSLTEIRVDNYLVLILGVTQRRLGSHLPSSVKGCVWLSHPPCLILFSFSPEANQYFCLYWTTLGIWCSSPKWAAVCRKLFCSYFTNSVSLFPAFY